MKNKKLFLLALIILVILVFTIFHNLQKFYSETDDELSIMQLLNYDKLDLYDIANDPKSSSYNNKYKRYLRELQSKKNDLIETLHTNQKGRIIETVVSSSSKLNNSYLVALECPIKNTLETRTINIKFHDSEIILIKRSERKI